MVKFVFFLWFKSSLLSNERHFFLMVNVAICRDSCGYESQDWIKGRNGATSVGLKRCLACMNMHICVDEYGSVVPQNHKKRQPSFTERDKPLRKFALKKKDDLNAESQAINTYRIWEVSNNCCRWPRVCLCSVCGQPRRRSLGKPKLSSLVFGTGILPHLQIDSLLFKTAQFFGIDPLSFLLESHFKPEVPARNFLAHSVCACGALQAVSSVSVQLCFSL